MEDWKSKSNIVLGLVLVQLYLLWLGFYLSGEIVWKAVLILIPWLLLLGYTKYKVYENR